MGPTTQAERARRRDRTDSAARRRSGRRGVALAAVTVVLAAAASGCSHPTNSSAQVFSAEQGVRQAENLVASIAARVSPGAVVADSASRAGPDACDSPRTGVYYTIFKTFPAPAGAVGATARAAVTAALGDAGFTVRDAGESGGWPTLTGTASYLGLRVLLSPDTPEVRVVVDTACGAP